MENKNRNRGESAFISEEKAIKIEIEEEINTL